MNRATLQILQFLAAVGIGIVLSILYDFYRVWLKRGRSRWVTAVGDAVFACVALGGTFLVLLWLNKAEVRFYILLAIALGALLYLRYCSPVVFPCLQRVFYSIGVGLKFVLKIIKQILIIIFKPFIILSTLLYRLCYLLFQLLRKIGQRLRLAYGFTAKKAQHGSKNLKNKTKKVAGRFKKPKKNDL